MFRKQMTILREVHADAWCVRLDLGHQVLHMEVPEFVLPGQHGGPPLSPVLPHEEGDAVSAANLLVPVFYDFARRRLKVWAFLGWQSTEARVEYRQTPDILTVRPESAATGAFTSPPLVLFGGDSHRFAVPVVAEVSVSRLLDRDQFRKHCDRFRTRSAILANLK